MINRELCNWTCPICNKVVKTAYLHRFPDLIKKHTKKHAKPTQDDIWNNYFGKDNDA